MFVNRWQTRGGKYWCELYKDEGGYSYKTDNGGGALGNITESQAYQSILYIIDTGNHKYKIKNESIHNDAYWSAKERTKNLSLDERVNILRSILKDLDIDSPETAKGRNQEISDKLGSLGYLPMMFGAAARTIVSGWRR